MPDPASELAALEHAQLRRHLRQLESPQGTEILLSGRSYLNFSSNDYLGLCQAPWLIETLQKAVGKYGAGSGAARLVCGSLPPHRHLEDALAMRKQTEAALSFSSGYAASVGTLSALLGKQDFLVLDKLAHASLIDGARLCGATLRVFPHNNVERLEQILIQIAAKRQPEQRVLIVTESVFSMDGDTAPLREIIALKNRFDAWLLVDEAHSFGVFGPHGSGLAAELKLSAEIELHLGTLSKSVGLSGGFVAGNRALMDLLINKARSFIYSTAPPPAYASAAAEVVGSFFASAPAQTLRTRLAANRAYFSPLTGNSLQERLTPIFPWVIGTEAAALSASEQLLHAGLLVPAIRFPTVPRGQARLRMTFSALHTIQQLEILAQALKQLPIHPLHTVLREKI